MPFHISTHHYNTKKIAPIPIKSHFVNFWETSIVHRNNTFEILLYNKYNTHGIIKTNPTIFKLCFLIANGISNKDKAKIIDIVQLKYLHEESHQLSTKKYIN